ncbi:MAG: sarcosine oxidase [Alphaproteobacteria bacterium]
MGLAPQGLNRRSFVYRELVELKSEFAELNGYACAVTCGADSGEETARAQDLAIADLCALRRSGYKGQRAIEWVRSQGAVVTDENNMTAVQSDGSRIARLADTEVLILGDLFGGGRVADELEDAWGYETGLLAYPIPREDTNFWFAVSGRHAAAMFAKVCGVDLRPHKFPEGGVAQTSLARMNAIIVRHDVGGTLAFDVLADSASAAYVWSSLIDAMDEFGGRAVGLKALRNLT